MNCGVLVVMTCRCCEDLLPHGARFSRACVGHVSQLCGPSIMFWFRYHPREKRTCNLDGALGKVNVVLCSRGCSRRAIKCVGVHNYLNMTHTFGSLKWSDVVCALFIWLQL